MGILETPTSKHWNYFLALEDDVERLARYVELTQANFETHSIEIMRILFGACSEIDVVAKLLCKKIESSSRASKINLYRNEITAAYPQLANARVNLPQFGLDLTPWLNWKDARKSPYWWKAYNDVKHERNEYFRDANLQNCLNAVGALFVLLLFFYLEEADRGDLRPSPRLFRAGAPFDDSPSFYDQATRLYRIMPPAQ